MSERRFRALDLFCSAGGMSAGLHRAGFEVTGVDHIFQPRYPFKFIQADALTFDLAGYDLYVASPPCQRYTRANLIHRRTHPIENYPDHVADIRARLEATGEPYIIENVAGAPLVNPVMLCGQMVGLPHLYRHRYFESNLTFAVPPHPKHRGHTNASRGYSSFANGATVICVGGNNFNPADGALAMGINWMGRKELAQAIPPAYGELLGRQVLDYLARRHGGAPAFTLPAGTQRSLFDLAA